jgi:hypothetical protein
MGIRRVAEKQASRDRETRALAAGKTTLEVLQRENTPISLTRAPIDFSRSKSPLW